MTEEIKHSRKFSVTQKQYVSTFNLLAWSTRIANSQGIVSLLVIVTHPIPWNILLLYHIWGDTVEVYLLSFQSVLSFKFLILQPHLWEHFSIFFSSSFFFFSLNSSCSLCSLISWLQPLLLAGNLQSVIPALNSSVWPHIYISNCLWQLLKFTMSKIKFFLLFSRPFESILVHKHCHVWDIFHPHSSYHIQVSKFDPSFTGTPNFLLSQIIRISHLDHWKGPYLICLPLASSLSVHALHHYQLPSQNTVD